MRGGERAGDLRRDGGGAHRRERAFLSQQLREARPAHVLHHDEASCLVGAGVVYGDDVRVAETRRRARLALEARHRARVGGLRIRQQLHRHGAVEHAVTGEVDDPHPSHADRLEQQIAAAEQGRLARYRGRGRAGAALAGPARPRRSGGRLRRRASHDGPLPARAARKRRNR